VPEVTGESVFQLGQGRQIIHVHDMCNECGNCATFCVHQGKPYQDKPRLFRSAHDFEKEINNAFHIHKNLEGVVIRRREGGSESRLILGGGNDEFVFENDLVRVTFTGEDFHIRAMALRKPFAGDLTLMAPAEMYLIGRGVLSSLAFLL
jgi:putative selenate reductase